MANKYRKYYDIYSYASVIVGLYQILLLLYISLTLPGKINTQTIYLFIFDLLFIILGISMLTNILRYNPIMLFIGIILISLRYIPVVVFSINGIIKYSMNEHLGELDFSGASIFIGMIMLLSALIPYLFFLYITLTFRVNFGLNSGSPDFGIGLGPA